MVDFRFCVFSCNYRLYKSFARKPWLNGLPRASRQAGRSRDPEGRPVHLCFSHVSGIFRWLNSYCRRRGTRYELENIKQSFLGKNQLPICKFCGGLIKTATISFGQAMPIEPVQRAEGAARHCDLFICIGSSLVVHPAAQIPLIAKDNGATLVILNREATALDEYADLIINDEIGKILPAAIAT